MRDSLLYVKVFIKRHIEQYSPVCFEIITIDHIEKSVIPMFVFLFSTYLDFGCVFVWHG
jgi:hypothetical protein